MKQIIEAIVSAFEKKQSVVLCSVIAASGSTPRGAGAKMIVFPDGGTSGTIGGGAVELVVTQIATERHHTRHSLIKGFDLSSDQKADLGMVCGGNATVHFQYLDAKDLNTCDMIRYAFVRICKEKDAWLITALREDAVWQMGIWADGILHFTQGLDENGIKKHFHSSSVLIQDEPQLYIEPLVQSGRLYIFGGGHVAQALVPAVSAVGFRAVVYEDRERFADTARFPDATETILGDFSQINKYISIGSADYIAIITRGHEADHIVLEQSLRTSAAYIGLIGSRNKMKHTKEKLHKAGFREEDFLRIHNPIGLNILAETPAEIAVSITAELILHRAQMRREKDDAIDRRRCYL